MSESSRDYFIGISDLIELLGSAGEYAFIDVREAVAVQHAGTPLVAVHVPSSRIEVDIARLVPRRSTPVVLIDGGGEEQTALRAAAVLRGGGYHDVRVLRGGTEAWRKAGYELYAGPALAQAFGEWVEERYATPHLSAEALRARIDQGEKIVLLDSRPLAEFENHSVPGAVSAPGAELVHRTRGAIPSDASLVVVNCAGRTRAILGAQALITAGFIRQPVASLEHGTQGWLLAGAELEHGRRAELPAPSTDSGATDAVALAERLGVRFTTAEEVERASEDAGQTLYLFDIRTPEEYAGGHLRGARSVPSWELVPGVFRFAATRNARLVLVDNAATAERAVITAWWLRNIGWGSVSVLAGWPAAHTTTELPLTAAFPVPSVATISIDDAARAIHAENAVVIDVGSSLHYQKRRVPGAWYAVRSQLAQVIELLPGGASIIVTSDDGEVARYAAADLAARTHIKVFALAGGTAAWLAAGQAVDTSPGRYLTGTADWPGHVWSFQGERLLAGFRQNLGKGPKLADQIRRDATSPFRIPEPSSRAARPHSFGVNQPSRTRRCRMTTSIADYQAVRPDSKPITATLRKPIARFDPKSREVRAVLEEARRLSARRDAERISPEDTLRKLRQLGIAAARVPVELGGAGLSLPEIFSFVLELSEADANIAHSLRNHFLATEGFNRPSRWAVGDEVLNAVREGHLIGTSGNEVDSAAPAGTYNAFETKLVPEGDGYRLTAQKGYSTGNLYVSYLLVAAWLPDGSAATAFIPADRAGVEVPDDWDGIGQKLTGSGSTSYTNVRVEAHEVQVSPQKTEVRAFPGTYAQLWMTTVVVGSLKAAVRETIEFVQQRRRNYYHGLQESPRNEPSVHETIGQATANAYVAEAAVHLATRALDEAWSFKGEPSVQAVLSRKAAIAAANAKVVIDPLALETTSFLFEAGGASAVRESAGLDRHWRNIRTLASHNPGTYKRRVLGDHALNGAELPTAAYF